MSPYRPMMPQRLPRRECPVCRTSRPVRVNGELREHKRYEEVRPGFHVLRTCPGSGQKVVEVVRR